MKSGRNAARSLRSGLRARARRSPRARRLYYRFVGYRQAALMQLAALRGGRGEHRVNAANLVWIFCASRSGSTWLRSMLAELPRFRVWEEPKVGQLFGEFYARAQQGQLGSKDFILGDPIRSGWLRSIRNFVLDGAGYSHPLLTREDYLVVKEPDGAIGAPLIMEALPESRMILLVRDPRDVAASALDATRAGSWMYEGSDRVFWKDTGMTPEEFVRIRAETYLQSIGSARRAFDAHRGRKTLIRYEDLKEDTLGTLRRACRELELPADEATLARAVGKHAWENIPEREKGRGKFYRRGAAGGWREDLSPGQARIVEEITAPLLRELYP